MKKKIIINADDFGLTSKVNEAVLKAHRFGTLTSATVMANGLALEEAVDIAKENPDLGVGVHLNLTVLKPILPAIEISTLVDKKGFFTKDYYRLPFKKTIEVKKEWTAQIEKVLSLGLRPTHLDSHHHIHLFPPFTKVILELAGEYSFDTIRLISPHSFNIMNVKGIQKTLAQKSFKLGSLVKKAPQTVIGIENYTAGKIGDLIQKLQPGIHELYLHPGLSNDPQLEGVSSLKEQRQKDYDLLLNKKLKEVLAHEDIQLVNYSVFSN